MSDFYIYNQQVEVDGFDQANLGFASSSFCPEAPLLEANAFFALFCIICTFTVSWVFSGFMWPIRLFPAQTLETSSKTKHADTTERAAVGRGSSIATRATPQ